MVALEEQKSALGRELSTLRLAHNKVRHRVRPSAVRIPLVKVVLLTRFLVRHLILCILFRLVGSLLSGTAGKEEGLGKRFTPEVVVMLCLTKKISCVIILVVLVKRFPSNGRACVTVFRNRWGVNKARTS